MYILKNVSIFTCMSNIHGLLKIRQYTSHAAAKSPQSCPTLRDPIDGSPPGSPVPGLLQARTLEWVAISFSYCLINASEIIFDQNIPLL